MRIQPTDTDNQETPPGVLRKSLGSVTKMAPAQASDMDLIRQYTRPGADVKEDDFLVVSTLLAHDQVDRSFEKFPKSYLDRFAATINGRSLLEGHDYSKSGKGRWIDAEVRPVSAEIKELPAGSLGLFAKFYVDAKSQLARDIDLGIAKDVSIGFRADTLTCDLCSKDVWGGDCPHFPGKQYDGRLATATYGGDASKAEAVEGSLVWLGCQPGAQVMGQSSPLYARKMALAQAAQEKNMELQEALDEIKRLKPLAEAGERYKAMAERYEASLREEILRLTGVKEFASTKDMKAADRAKEFTGQLLAGASTEHLEKMHAALKEQTKGLLASAAAAEGAAHVPVPGETPPQRKAGFGPQRRAMI